MNYLQYVLIGLSLIIALLAVLFFAGIIGPGTNPGQSSSVGTTLTLWSDLPETTFHEAFKAYADSTKTVISYKQANLDELVRAIARGEGPDLVIADAGWIRANRDIILPAPTTFTTRDFETHYIDAASQALVDRGLIMGVPLWLDPLVLFWNKDTFNAHSISLPPKDWSAFLQISNETKQTAEGGAVLEAGAALGRARNIPLAKEILSLLLLQLGGDLENRDGSFVFGSSDTSSKAGESALRFYTDFARQDVPAYTWNGTLPEPRDLFIQGKLAMMIDRASYMPVLQGKNPHLAFDIAPAPQVEKAEFPIYTGTIEGIAILRGSKKAAVAWDFAEQFSQNPAMGAVFKNETAAPALRALLAGPTLEKNPLFPLFKTASLNARYAHDSRPEKNQAGISEMIEGVADDRFTPAAAILMERAKINKEK